MNPGRAGARGQAQAWPRRLGHPENENRDFACIVLGCLFPTNLGIWAMSGGVRVTPRQVRPVFEL